MVVERLVDLGAHAPGDTPVAPGEEVRGLTVGEEGVEPPIQEQAALEPQRDGAADRDLEILLADPETLGDDVLESCLYLLRERLRAE